jgi:hypothetical protein
LLLQRHPLDDPLYEHSTVLPQDGSGHPSDGLL